MECELTRKEKEVYEKIKNMSEITAADLAEMNDVSYAAARSILEGLVAKTVLGAEWEPKGNRKRYIVRE